MLKETVQEQRALTGLVALGTAEEALEEAVKYAKMRKVFGKPLGSLKGSSSGLQRILHLLRRQGLCVIKPSH
jgi:hypothetical protein